MKTIKFVAQLPDKKFVGCEDGSVFYSPDILEADKFSTESECKEFVEGIGPHPPEGYKIIRAMFEWNYIQTDHGVCEYCGADRSGPSAEAHDENCPNNATTTLIIPVTEAYVISLTGDGAHTKIVYGQQLKQAVHDEYCDCKKKWDLCQTENVTNTVASLDDDELWSHDYPGYKRHIWLDRGEDYTLQIMRVQQKETSAVISKTEVEKYINSRIGFKMRSLYHTVNQFLLTDPDTLEDDFQIAATIMNVFMKFTARNKRNQ